jgi:hypothetical protein
MHPRFELQEAKQPDRHTERDQDASDEQHLVGIRHSAQEKEDRDRRSQTQGTGEDRG